MDSRVQAAPGHLTDPRPDASDGPEVELEVGPRRSARSRFRAGLVVITLAGLALRLLYVVVERGRPPSLDGIVSTFVAMSVANGDGFVVGGTPTALHPPLWTLLKSGATSLGMDTVLWHQLVACLVGASTVALVGLASRRVAGERVGLLAAGIAAASPNLWLWERELASETLVLPLIAAAVLLAHRFWQEPRGRTLVALGGLCGLLALTRAEQALLTALLVTPLALLASAVPLRQRLTWLVASGLLFVGVVSPWILYNNARFERPVLLTTSLGVNLGAANNPATYGGELLGGIDDVFWTTWDRSEESLAEARDRRAGLTYISEHLDRVPVVLAAREGRTWGFYRPFQQMRLDQHAGNSSIWVYRAALASHWALVPFAAVGVLTLRRRRAPLLPLLVPLVIVVISTALTFGQTRFRAPAEISICILGAVGIHAVLQRARRRGITFPYRFGTKA